MNISGNAEIRSGSLYLDRKPLDIETHSVDQLRYVLTSLGSNAIVDHIEEIYDKTVRQNPHAEEILRPSVRAMNLGRDESTVLTPLGQYNYTSLHRSPLEIDPSKHGYWNAIGEYGFTPVIQSRMGARATAYSVLMLRNPETDPIPITPIDTLPAALGFVEPPEIRNIRPELHQAYENNDPSAIKALWERVADENQATIDKRFAFIEMHGELYRRGAEAAVRVGRDISEAILRVEIIGDDYLLDPNRYEDALFDIHDHVRELCNEGDENYEGYAYVMELDAVDEELKREVDRIYSLRY